MRAQILAAALCIAALSPSPAAAQTPGPAQVLADCAGAVAAYGGLDVLAYPLGAVGEWSEFLGYLLSRINVTPGLEGMTGRYAASAARAYWETQPRAAQQARVRRCREQLGSA